MRNLGRILIVALLHTNAAKGTEASMMFEAKTAQDGALFNESHL